MFFLGKGYHALMTKFRWFVVSFLGFVLPLVPVQAAEIIRSFQAEGTLSADRRLVITETITYDFGDIERHGIFRNIPETYDRDGAKYRLRLDVTDVQRDGLTEPWSESSSGGDVEIKIGDANTTITGQHTYRITYETSRAINDFPDHTELYWNVTGNGWQVPMQAVSLRLAVPGKPDRVLCYSGYLGSDAQDCSIAANDAQVEAHVTQGLEPGEGLTVVIAFPTGVIRSLTTWEKIARFVADNSWALLPIIVFIGMFRIWWKKGREPRGRGTVIAQYEEPAKLTPALMSALVEQKVPQKAITATILDLARRGFLTIKFDGEPSGGWLTAKPKFSLVKGKPADEALLPYERTLLKGLFSSKDEVKIEDLKGTFWKEIETSRKELFDELRTRNLFGANPATVRALWVGGAIGFVVLLQFFAAFFGGLFIVSLVLCAIIIAAFGWNMPRMTEQGAVIAEEVQGLKLFLSVTEKARLDFTDAPERTPQQFERFLPAAVAFGVEEKWAEQFKGIDLQPPSYVQGNVGTWNAMYFAHAIGSFHEASAASMYSPPRSTAGGGGSGFSGGGSGGGFGGGGGGSW